MVNIVHYSTYIHANTPMNKTEFSISWTSLIAFNSAYVISVQSHQLFLLLNSRPNARHAFGHAAILRYLQFWKCGSDAPSFHPRELEGVANCWFYEMSFGWFVSQISSIYFGTSHESMIITVLSQFQ